MRHTTAMTLAGLLLATPVSGHIPKDPYATETRKDYATRRLDIEALILPEKAAQERLETPITDADIARFAARYGENVPGYVINGFVYGVVALKQGTYIVFHNAFRDGKVQQDERLETAVVVDDRGVRLLGARAVREEGYVPEMHRTVTIDMVPPVHARFERFMNAILQTIRIHQDEGNDSFAASGADNLLAPYQTRIYGSFVNGTVLSDGFTAGSTPPRNR